MLTAMILLAGCGGSQGSVAADQDEAVTSTSTPPIVVRDDQRRYDKRARAVCDAHVAQEVETSGGYGDAKPQRDLVAAFDSTVDGGVAWAKADATKRSDPPVVAQKLNEILIDAKAPLSRYAAVCWIVGDYLVPDPNAGPLFWFVQLVVPDDDAYGLLVSSDPNLEPARPTS